MLNKAPMVNVMPAVICVCVDEYRLLSGLVNDEHLTMREASDA